MLEIINKSQRKIIETIFENPGINLRGIIDLTKLSPNYVLKFINSLVQRGVLNEERLEKGKRVYLRRFFLNFKSNMTRNIFMIVKEEIKEEFLKKYPRLRPIFKQMIEEIKRLDFIIVYGSYARLSARKDSDIDILLVGNIKDKDKIREILVSLEIETSIKIETLDNFKKRINDALHSQIIREGVLIHDEGKFIETIKESEGVK